MLTELTLLVELDQVEPWSEALLAAGALSVSAEDADADSPDEQPLYGEPGLGPVQPAWRRTRLAALIDAAEQPVAQLLEQAASSIDAPLPDNVATRGVAPADWVRLTQAQFEPIDIDGQLLICPSWHAGAATGHRVVLQMDPGLAFGTGSHPTTRLCLQWLVEHRPAGRVIDYGCGSGILAIAAAKLGARSVSAIDIDPQALTATAANATANRVDIDLRGAEAQSLGLIEPGDLLIANILAAPLKLLAPTLCAMVAPGGRLLLSGVLERQAEDVANCYMSQLPVQVIAQRDGWVALAGTKSS